MRKLLFPVALLAFSAIASADIVTINLSGATTGTLISAPGGSFASTFKGQTIVGGTGISGAPTNPLALQAANTLNVEFFSPGVSPAANSILPQVGNQGPLSLLLSSDADSITWTMGFADSAGPIRLALFGAGGNLVNESAIALFSGYHVYTVGGLGAFRGLTFFNDTDPAGLRYMNFSYTSAVPEPAGWALMVTIVALCGGFKLYRARRTA